MLLPGLLPTPILLFRSTKHTHRTAVLSISSGQRRIAPVLSSMHHSLPLTLQTGSENVCWRVTGEVSHLSYIK